MLDCEQALDLISAKLDGALTAEESAALEEHLAACPACRALLADFEELHLELPKLAAQPPADLKDHIMAEVRRSKVTPFQGKKKQWRWRSLASLAAVLVLVFVGSSAMRQWEGAASRAENAPAAGDSLNIFAQGETAGDTITAPAAVTPDTQSQVATDPGKGTRNLENNGEATVQDKTGETQETEGTVPPATPAPVQSAEPSAQPNTYTVGPEQRIETTGLDINSTGTELTQAQAVEKLAQHLGWQINSPMADSSGVLTGPSDDGVKRTITCIGLNEAGTGWVCQVEEISSEPDGTASCTTYTVPLDGSEITQP